METTKVIVTSTAAGMPSTSQLKTLRASLSAETIRALCVYSLEIGAARVFTGEVEELEPVELDALVNMLISDSHQLRFELLSAMWASFEEEAGEAGLYEIAPSAPLWSPERLAGQV